MTSAEWLTDCSQVMNSTGYRHSTHPLQGPLPGYSFPFKDCDLPLMSIGGVLVNFTQIQPRLKIVAYTK